MRSRILHPGFFTDHAIADLPHSARLLFAGLWCIADREGRIIDAPKCINGLIFPHDKNITAEQVDAWLDALTPHHIERYEVGGQQLIQVCNFLKYQKPHLRETPSSLPANPGQTLGKPKANLRQALGEPVLVSISISDSPPTFTLTGEHTPPRQNWRRQERFDEFWAEYPRKVGKLAAQSKFDQVCKTQEKFEEIVSALRAQKPMMARQEMKHVPHPQTWLNQGRWMDEPPEATEERTVFDDLLAEIDARERGVQ
jgi:hypothetical protein